MLSPPSPRCPSPAPSLPVSEISVGAPSPPPQSPHSSHSPHSRSELDNSMYYQQTIGSPDIDDRMRGYESSIRRSDKETRKDGDDYFRPLKKLKMMNIKEAKESRISSPDRNKTKMIDGGVKSFSIVDILGHKRESNPGPASRIVRPWDLHAQHSMEQNLERLHHHLKTQITEHMKYKHYELNLKSHSLNPFEHRINLNPFELHQQQLQLQEHIKAQQYQLLRHQSLAAYDQKEFFNNSESGSDRSSSVASDCCSPEIGGSTTATSTVAAAGGSRGNHKGGTPLDALFQMTSKTFDETAAENAQDAQSHLNLFNNRPQTKKKRKSRTAFTNHQIFELEKRFLYQKYLSPADRDEIASSLGLSNAQVITWFQNRRAKLKRDMEELKKDVESAKVLTAHKTFLENVTDLGILKKKAVGLVSNDCPTNLVINK